MPEGELQPSLEELRDKVMDYQDLLKVPTLVTAGSLALVLSGCRSIDTVAGVNKIVAGRTGDLLDGFLARSLNQSSDMGALADTAADKAGMLAIGASAWHKDVVPHSVLATIGAKHAATTGLTAAYAYKFPTRTFRPNQAGKLAMGMDNLALFGYLYGSAFENEYPELELHDTFRNVGRSAFIAGSVLSVPATLSYATRIFND